MAVLAEDHIYSAILAFSDSDQLGTMRYSYVSGNLCLHQAIGTESRTKRFFSFSFNFKMKKMILFFYCFSGD